jgi:hypothetical protein
LERKSGKKWNVVNKDTGRVLGSHDSRGQAVKQLQAVSINYYGTQKSASMDVVKALAGL